MDKPVKFPTELKYWKYEIERVGRRLGLKFSPTIYQMLQSEEMSEVVAYDGYPIRYHHWRFGQESLKQKKLTTRFGLMRYYELIIPTLPCYAYLLDTNSTDIQKLVMAHAGLGHNDFFENNAWFRAVPRNLHTAFASHAQTLDGFRAVHGKERVDEFLEACLSLDNCIDILGSLIRRLPDRDEKPDKKQTRRQPTRIPRKEGLPSYMDDVINPRERIEEQRKDIKKEEQREADIARGLVLPEAPVRDVMGFLMEHASLEPWQREVLHIVRDESYALYVGAQTKIMNEGWASDCHAEVMAGQGVALDHEVMPFARLHSGVLHARPAGINPYRLGCELWQDIQFRWDTGRHGAIYEECREHDVVSRWDEFAVFKNLFERHGSITSKAFEEEWAMFCTLIRETQEGRGAYPQAFFTSKKWVLEWLALHNAQECLMERRNQLLKALLVEEEIAAELSAEGLAQDDLKRFKLRFEISKRNKMDPDLDWTKEELEQEIRHCETLLVFKDRFSKGQLTRITHPIPESWLPWSRRFSGELALGEGWEKKFEVRESHNDTSFIQDFFTPEFCEKNNYYTIAIKGVHDPTTWEEIDVYVVRSTAFKRVKEALLRTTENLGQPKVEIVNANFDNNHELLLRHLYDGRDLDTENIGQVLRRLWIVWGHKKRVHLETVETQYPKRKPLWYYWRPYGYRPPEPEGVTRHPVRYSYDGVKGEKKFLDAANPVGWPFM